MFDVRCPFNLPGISDVKPAQSLSMRGLLGCDAVDRGIGPQSQTPLQNPLWLNKLIPGRPLYWDGPDMEFKDSTILKEYRHGARNYYVRR